MKVNLVAVGGIVDAVLIVWQGDIVEVAEVAGAACIEDGAASESQGVVFAYGET